MMDVKSVVLDEIGLEGLDGITISSLWVRLKELTDFSLNLDHSSSKAYVWKNVILKFAKDNLKFYVLPKERPTLIIYDRYKCINKETGYCLSNDENMPDSISTEICPVSSGGIMGSCKDFNKRELIELNNLKNLNLDEIEHEYGNTLVIVADQQLRNNALRINYNDPQLELSPIQYCIVERCGQTRKLGEVTFGKEAANFKEPSKTLFYFRKLLLKKKLITKQIHTVYNNKTQSITRGLLLMLPRFHIDRKSPLELAALKISEVLKTMQDQKCEYFSLKTECNIRTKPFKHVFSEFPKYFRVVDLPDPNKNVKKIRYVQLIKQLNDDNSSDEEEANDDDKQQAVKTIDKVKLFSPQNILVNRPLLTQSYNIVESYSIVNGISLREFQNELIIPRLDARMLIRMLERMNKIQSITTSIGRQKITRYFLKNQTNSAVTNFQHENNQLDLGKKASLITLKRANIILNAVKEHRMIDQLFYFKKIILDAEKNLPYKIDQRSIRTILQMLSEAGHVNWIKTSFEKNNLVKRYNLICIPSINEDDDIVKERIEQTKFKFFSSNNSNTLFLPVESNDKEKDEVDGDEKSHYDDWSLLANLRSDDTELVYQPSIGRQYGLEPKLKKIITFYKFIFFTLSDECKKDNNFDDTDWRKHIQPLPKGYNKDTCLLGDLIPRIPLSIFVKVVFITYVIPGLDEMLKDPVCRNYTLHMLPADLIKNLFRKRKYIFCMVELLTTLTYLNLVELDSRMLSIKEHVTIRLLKTSQFSEDGLVKNYRLENLNDVEMFANDLALHGSRNDCKKCSFDSRLYLHNPRNWSYLPKFQRGEQAKSVRRFSRLRNAFEENELDCAEFATFRNPFKSIPPALKSSASRPKSKRSNAKRRKTSDNNLNDSSTADENQQQMNSNDKEKNTDDQTGGQSTNGLQLTKRLRRIGYDKEDLNALSLMRKQRAEWSKEEDSFLLMCRVASILINPTSTNFICVNKNVLRDELKKYLSNLAFDKTSKACQRRLMYMLKNPRTRAHILDWVAEVKQDPEMSSIKKPNVPITHTKEWNACFIDLLGKLLKKFENEDHFSDEPNKLTNFQSLDEIYKQYNIIESEIHCIPQKPILFFQPNNIVDIYVNVVLNVLSSSMLSNMFDNDDEEDPNNSTKSMLALFKIYQRYPDTMIRAVVNKMKSNGMIAKMRSSDRSKIKSKDKKLALYKISQYYCQVLKSRFSLDTLAAPIELNNELNNLVIRENSNSTETALLTNLITMNRANILINLPENFVSLKDQSNRQPLHESNVQNDDTNQHQSDNDNHVQINDNQNDDEQMTNDANNDDLRQNDDQMSNEATVSQSKRRTRSMLCSLRQRIVVNNFSDKNQITQSDYLILNKCNIDCRISTTKKLVNLDKFLQLLERQNVLVNLDESDNQIELNNTERTIVKEVAKTKELGLNYDHLFESFKKKRIKETTIQNAIDHLLNEQILFEVGVEDLRLVTHKYISPWLVHGRKITKDDCTFSKSQAKSSEDSEKEINDDQSSSPMEIDDLQSTNGTNSPDNDLEVETDSSKDSRSASSTIKPKMIYFLPKFWKNPFGELDKKVISLFLSGILGHILANPGIKQEDLISFFKFCLPPVQTLEVLDLLIAANCIEKHTRKTECNFTLFGGCETRSSVFYEPTKESFITLCIIKKILV